MAVSKGCSFINELKSEFSKKVTAKYEQLQEEMSTNNIKMVNYLENQDLFLPWLIRTVV